MEGAEGPPPSPPAPPFAMLVLLGLLLGARGAGGGLGLGCLGGLCLMKLWGGGDVGVSALWDCVGGLEGALLYGAGCGFWEDCALWDHGRGLGGLCLMALCGGTLGVSAL